MKVHKVVLSIVDFDELGPEEIKSVIENQKFPNRCIHPDVMGIDTVDIGEWSDDHPLNNMNTHGAEFNRIFGNRVAFLEAENEKLKKRIVGAVLESEDGAAHKAIQLMLDYLNGNMDDEP